MDGDNEKARQADRLKMIRKTDSSEFESYLSDASNMKGYCSEIVFPSDSGETAQILLDANKDKIHVTVSAGRTGLTGGAVPKGGILLSVEKMTEIIDFDEKNRIVYTAAGALLSEIQDFALERNLFYPPDPTERTSRIGGNAACNSSGARSFFYGPTRNFISELEVVLPDGQVIRLKRGELFADNGMLKLKTENGGGIVLKIPDIPIPASGKNAAGYFLRRNMDAIDLFIGSEGTLGIITKLGLKLIDRPEAVFSCIVFFNSDADALNFIAEAGELGLSNRAGKSGDICPRALEFFDKNSLDFLRSDFGNIPPSASAAVWFEQETHSGGGNGLIENWLGIIENNGGSGDNIWAADNKNDIEKIKLFRHRLPEKINEYMSSMGMTKIGTDTAVPRDKFLNYYKYCTKTVAEAGIRFVVYGHFGNSHIHLNMLPETAAEYEKAKSIYSVLCRKAVEMNGTISAEHGIGKLKRKLLYFMYGKENIFAMAELKKKLDPNLILNMGNMFDPEIFAEIN